MDEMEEEPQYEIQVETQSLGEPLPFPGAEGQGRAPDRGILHVEMVLLICFVVHLLLLIPLLLALFFVFTHDLEL